jgi:D-inositol-3-phosphate glycosyltransferase
MLSTHSSPVGQLGARDTGGMSVYVREVAAELGKQGHLVDIFTRTSGANESEIIELAENVRLIHLDAGLGEDLHKIAIYPYIPEFAANLETFRRTEGLNYDVVFSHYWLSGCAGEFAEKWWRVPHMLMFHTLAAVKNTIGEREPELRLETETRLARSCRRIIAATEREKENIVNFYGAPAANISVIPCGVNLDLFRPQDKKESRKSLGLDRKKVVLFVGRIEPLKGVERLLTAFSHLPDRDNLRLLVIGGDAQSAAEIARLKEISNRLGIRDNVTFTGLVEQDRLPLYYNAADVTVVPSYYESFGLVPLESLACGTPVVATDVGDLKNIIRPGVTGYVVAGNTHDIAEKIGSVLSWEMNDDTRDAIRESIAAYSWQSVARRLERECRRLVAEYGVLTY